VELQEQRAQAVLRCAQVEKKRRAEFEKMLTHAQGSRESHAAARATARGAMPRAIERFAFADCRAQPPDLEVDAERLYALSQAYRNDKKEAEMFTALKHPCAEVSR